jgi:hypothetical protein
MQSSVPDTGQPPTHATTGCMERSRTIQRLFGELAAASGLYFPAVRFMRKTPSQHDALKSLGPPDPRTP